MKSAQTSDPQALPLEEQLIGVNAKTGLYPGARSWSGGRFRILGKGPLESYCYHVMSRTCGGEVFFDEVEKEALRRVIWRMAEFSGIKVVTYCLMSNHFHLLAEVPHRDTWLLRFDGPQGEAKLLEHLGILYSRAYLGLLRDELADLRSRGMVALAEQRVAALKKRFCDLSLFVKEVKERFSRWFNKRRGRRGTLWMDRFKSVLVEGKGEPLRTMAAYIDLNPVRAGLVKDPKDYRWCGYAEALGGSRRAQRGLCKAQGKPVDGWKSAFAAEAYRCLLHAEGREVKDAQNENVVSSGVTADSARAVLAEKGKLSPAEMVRLRVRYFSDGVVLGSKAFVQGIFEAQRDLFGPKRKQGARRMPESDAPFYTLRQLRLRPLG
ncbi:MAG: transposase [Prosthecobacter sp.]|uniref:transposase n=1 Tax=Prosthecobacter sp. TaxID=1965333 RepID=UPI0026250EBA|nr:transposase [Prosthecobacter sp.]MCF7789065.1 transposase [Prosthecobacter sp.]